MSKFALVAILVLALSFAIASFAIQKTSLARTAIFGLLLILVMLIAFYSSNYSSWQACLRSACESAGLPADCSVSEFGCGEGYGPAVAMLVITGIIQIIIYFIGLIPIWFIHSRRIAPKETGGQL